VTVAEKPRTRVKARARTVELVTAAPLERISILITPTSSAEEVDAFRDALLAAAPGVDPAKVTTGFIGASTGPHLGPDLMGAAFMRARPA
jgi:fatty acid-binding protein DegV